MPLYRKSLSDELTQIGHFACKDVPLDELQDSSFLDFMQHGMKIQAADPYPFWCQKVKGQVFWMMK
jgi:hypothetical protein